MNLNTSSMFKFFGAFICLFFGTYCFFRFITNSISDDTIRKNRLHLFLPEGVENHPLTIVNQYDNSQSMKNIRIHRYENVTFIINFLANQSVSNLETIILDLDKKELIELCHQLSSNKNLRSFPIMYALNSVPEICSTIVSSVQCSQETHFAVFIHYLAQLKTTEVIVLFEDHETASYIKKEMLNYLQMTPIFIGIENLNEANLISILQKKPKAPIIFTSGEILQKVFALNESHFDGHLLFAHLSVKDKLILFESNSNIRKAFDNQLFFTTASSLHKNSSKHYYNRHKNSEISLLLRSWDVFLSDSHLNTKFNRQSNLCELDLVSHLPNNSQHFAQNHKWYLIASYYLKKFLPPLNQWEISAANNSIFKIWTLKDIEYLATQNNCFPTEVSIVTTDQYFNIKVIKKWTLSYFPLAVAVPSFPSQGYSIIFQCVESNVTRPLEITCLRSSSNMFMAECLSVESTHRRKRVTRSFRSNHIIRTQNTIDRQGVLGFIDPRRQKFRDIMPKIGGCVGASGGCTLCFMYFLKQPAQLNLESCYGACAVGVAGACTSLVSMGIQQRFDNTVICTELFQQGRIGVTSYIADAKFGAKLSHSNILAMQGYRKAAKPVVSLMKKSYLISEFVNNFAKPWIRHMEFEESIRQEDDSLGWWITYVGLRVCHIIGFFITTSKLVLCVYFISFWVLYKFFFILMESRCDIIL